MVAFVSASECEEMRAAYQDGMTYEEMAEQFGCTTSTIWRHVVEQDCRHEWASLAEMGAEFRPPGPEDVEAIARDVRRVADQLGYPPRATEYDEHGQWARSTIYRHTDVHEWDMILETAGLAPADKPDRRHEPTANAQYTDADMLDWLIVWYETFGIWPTEPDTRGSPLPAGRTYETRFGSFTAAREGAKARHAKQFDGQGGDA